MSEDHKKGDAPKPTKAFDAKRSGTEQDGTEHWAYRGTGGKDQDRE